MANSRDEDQEREVRISGVSAHGWIPLPPRDFSNTATRRAMAKTVAAEMIEGKHFRSVEARLRTLADAIDRTPKKNCPKSERTPCIATACPSGGLD